MTTGTVNPLEMFPSVRDELTPRGKYLTMSKEYGTVSTEELEEIAASLESSNRPEDLECAASALIEATIFSDRSPETLEDNLFMIDYAEELLQAAVSGHWQALEEGRVHYDDQGAAIRAEVQLDCIDLYRDMLYGGISKQTRETVFNKLTQRGRYAYRHAELSGREYSQKAFGVANEIAILMGGLTEEGVFIPSTPRGGSGERGDRSSTHDLNYIAFDDNGDIGMCIGIELKNLSKPIDRIKAELRYDRNKIILIHTQDLGVTWENMPSLFNHDGLTFSARRAFTPVREGLYQQIAYARRKWDSQNTQENPPLQLAS